MSAHPIIAIIRLARATVHALSGNSCTRPHIAAFGEINACPHRRDPQFRASAITGAGSQVRWLPDPIRAKQKVSNKCVNEGAATDLCAYPTVLQLAAVVRLGFAGKVVTRSTR
jgi:hypothetical protein